MMPYRVVVRSSVGYSVYMLCDLTEPTLCAQIANDYPVKEYEGTAGFCFWRVGSGRHRSPETRIGWGLLTGY